MNQFFFGPNFLEEINWNGFRFKIGAVNSESRSKISEGLKRLSADTIRNRFMGAKRGFTDKELNDLTLLDGHNHFALGVEDDQGHGIAVIRFSKQQDLTDVAEVGILVIDDFQKIGLGTILLKLLILAALERGIKHLSFTHLPENEGIVRLVKRIGTPESFRKGQDESQMILDLRRLDLDLIKVQLSEVLPKIGSFHLKT